MFVTRGWWEQDTKLVRKDLIKFPCAKPKKGEKGFVNPPLAPGVVVEKISTVMGVPVKTVTRGAPLPVNATSK